MKKYYELKSAVEFIENHLTENISQVDIARYSAASLSSLQKMFRLSLGYSLNEYITKRRMSEAAKRLVLENTTVTTLAYDYGYNSVESFSRAFKKIYGVLPSEYKKDAKHGEMFTSVGFSQNGVVRESERLITAVRKSDESFVVCFDIVGIIEINKISRQAGDVALAEALKRIHRFTDERYLVFRIGGDEFAVITPFKTADDAEKFMDKVLSRNSDSFLFDGKEINVKLRGWFGKNNCVSSAEYPEETLRESVKYSGVEKR